MRLLTLLFLSGSSNSFLAAAKPTFKKGGTIVKKKYMQIRYSNFLIISPTMFTMLGGEENIAILEALRYSLHKKSRFSLENRTYSRKEKGTFYLMQVRGGVVPL